MLVVKIPTIGRAYNVFLDKSSLSKLIPFTICDTSIPSSIRCIVNSNVNYCLFFYVFLLFLGDLWYSQ
jgi:uncharacterized membrane protein YwaF